MITCCNVLCASWYDRLRARDWSMCRYVIGRFSLRTAYFFGVLTRVRVQKFIFLRCRLSLSKANPSVSYFLICARLKMSSTFTEVERQQMQKLRWELGDILTADLSTDFNLYRWIHGLKGDTAEASRRLRTYIENRRAAGLDDPNFLESFYSYPVISQFAPYFSFTLTPNVINQTDNTVLFIQRYQNIDYHRMTKVMSCSQFLMLYFATCEWNLRQVLKRESESGRKSGLTIVFDLEHLPLLSYANPQCAIIKIFVLCLCLLQDYFCDMLHRLFIINAPSMLNLVLSIVKRFLNPSTRQKFTVISNKDDLFKYIHPTVLPVHYGGTRRLTQADFCLGGVQWNMDVDTCTIVPRSLTQEDLFVARKFASNPTSHHIEPKGKYDVKRRVSQSGAKLVWHFTVNSEIQFSVAQLLPDGKEIRLVPCCRVITPALPEEGSVTCQEAGEYALHFVNPGEGWFGVKLEYVVEIQPAS